MTELPNFVHNNQIAARRGLIWTALCTFILLGFFAVMAFRWADNFARSNTDQAALQQARGLAGQLNSELQKFRLLPIVLTEYPDARAVLENSHPDIVQRMNDKLELLAERTDAAAIYVIAKNGKTIAASNWRLPSSFIGQNYGFRPYFREAMTNKTAELYALGTISGRPGLFISHRIESASGALGVVVVKVEFDRLENQWAQQASPIFVTDDHGVVILTSKPEWRFRTIAPLDEGTRDAIRKSIQFGDLPLSPLPMERDGKAVSYSATDFREAVLNVAMKGAHLHVMNPLGPEKTSANAKARTIVLIAFILCAMGLIWVFRAAEKRRIREETRQMLEYEVAARTADLNNANQRYRSAREELAQASRLGSIGQITAGVAHEVNQPTAAIRSFAENARMFLDRGNAKKAKENLTTIIALTDRIGTITSELRNFAKRSTPAISPLALSPVIDGALLLVGDRIRSQAAHIERIGDTNTVNVIADRVRLEQIFVNLVQNALDAMSQSENPQILIETETDDDRVIITIADNGPGIDIEILDNLFTPFITGKPDGLGLGLGIARDIARDFGGELKLGTSSLGGAAFILELKHA